MELKNGTFHLFSFPSFTMKKSMLIRLMEAEISIIYGFIQILEIFTIKV